MVLRRVRRQIQVQGQPPMTDKTFVSTDAPDRTIVLSVSILVALGAYVLYIHSASYDFIYDDIKLIVDAPYPQGVADFMAVFTKGHWAGLPYYRPVSGLTMIIQKALHGNDPAPYHRFNVLLISLFAALVWILFVQKPMGIRPLPACLCTAIVVAHPVASCTVYPICSGRETLLPSIFSVACIVAYLRPGIAWRIASMALLMAALFSKEQAIVLPLILVLADKIGLPPWPAGRSKNSVVLRYIPVVCIIIFYFIMRMMALRGSEGVGLAVFDSPARPLLSYMYSIQVIFAPYISLVYEPVEGVWLRSLWRLAVCLVVVMAIVFCAYRSRSQARAQIVFWVGWFLIALLPTANFMVQEAPYDERYSLFPLVAVAGLLATLASSWWGNAHAAKYIIIMCAAASIVVCGLISRHRGQYFSNQFAFGSQWVDTNPKSAQAHRVLASALLVQMNRTDEAVAHLEESLRLAPSGPQASEVHSNLGAIQALQGNVGAAVLHFEKAVEFQPDNATAHCNLANALAAQGMLERAEQHFIIALRIAPDNELFREALRRVQFELERREYSRKSTSQE